MSGTIHAEASREGHQHETPPQGAHTPGPWHVFQTDSDWPHPGIEAKGISIVVIGARYEDCGVRGDSPDEARANARLIAAAPDMLAALRRIADLCDDTNGAHWLTKNDTTRALARAAIAKAGA